MAKKKKRITHQEIQARYLTAPLGKDFVRGFIPHCVQATDSPKEIVALFNVSMVTARMWIRILKGPQISRKGKIISRWEKPDFGSPNKKKLS